MREADKPPRLPNRIAARRDPRTVRIAGVDDALSLLIGQTLVADGWAVSSGEADWLVYVAVLAKPGAKPGTETGTETDTEIEAAAVIAELRAFASAAKAGAGQGRGIVLVLDLGGWQPRAGAPAPPFAATLAQRTLGAAVPMLALEFAPDVRVNAIGVIAAPVSDGLLLTPETDIAAALRFIVDAPALTGQMIALDGGRTALVPAPGSGTTDRP